MTSAVIVAAGKGTRMGGAAPDKLFLEIDGCPIVGYTWKRFEEAVSIDEIVLVVRSGMEPVFQELAKRLGFRKHFRVVPGGRERQDSVGNGLGAISAKTQIVAIHDAARPCISPEVIAETIRVAGETGAGVVAQPMTDTIKESEDGKRVTRTLDRSRLWAVQTPQCFRVEVLKGALEEAKRRGLNLTDDTAACELIGQTVHLVPSHKPNPKLTRPEDLPLLEFLLKRQAVGRA
jgi:2-C-methyl-D-erythritol 4-phosphate cytidylyltransferase